MLQRFAIVLSAAGLAMTAACSQSDMGITTAVKAKLAADDTVKAYQINVDTGKHVVTLNGVVGSPAAKEQAVLIARETKGVTGVVDDITVNRAVATSGAIEPKAESNEYASEKARDTADAVQDTAHDAKVKTENAAHDAKVKTEDAAHTAKVKTERAADKTGEVVKDSAITTDVKAKFLAEPGVSGLDIHVDTTNGVVTLTGTVKTKAEEDKAVSIARNSAGVKRVVNKMHVG